MKTYIGFRDGASLALVRVEIKVDGVGSSHKLNPCTDVIDHSNGYEWGYNGSGPAQLALAILIDHYGDTPEGILRARQNYLRFKDTVIAGFPKGGFYLEENRIDLLLFTYREDAGQQLPSLTDLGHLTRLASRVEIKHTENGFIVRAYNGVNVENTSRGVSYVAQQGHGMTLPDAVTACIEDHDEGRRSEALRQAELAALEMQTDAVIDR